MDGARDTFWIKSLNGTFLVLQIKAFGPIFFQISCRGQKVPFGQIFRMDWDGYALLVRPSRIPSWISKIIFAESADESLARLKGKIGEGPFFYDSIL